MLAASSGNTDLVKELLTRGADVSGKYAQTGQTALTLAKDNGHDDIVQLLQAAGAKQ
jgi:ankyrin repeat protein